VGVPIISYYNTIQTFGVNVVQPDSTIPPKVFWTVSVEDRDEDDDRLTAAEENALGLDDFIRENIPGIPDLWLATHFSGDLLLFGLVGLDMTADADGDGRTNREELLDGTDPNANDVPSAQQWIIVTGNQAEGVPATRTKQITIPAGQTVLLTIALASEEFVNGFTIPDETEQFDDLLTWNIEPTGQQAIEGQINVNARHYEWIMSEFNQQNLEGLPAPIYHEVTKVITAPSNGDLVINVEISATNIADGALPSYVLVGLLPLDLDLIHPAAGEVLEANEDSIYHCGKVAKKYYDSSTDREIEPLTKIHIKSFSGIPNDIKFRLKFSSGDFYKIYEDTLNANEVLSEQNEYDANTNKIFNIKGLKTSEYLANEEITLQVSLNNYWHDCDKVKFTVIEAVFQCWINLFIPVQWGDLPFPFSNPVVGARIFAGDDRDFYDLPLSNPATQVNTVLSSSRVHQQVIVVPYKVLDADGLIDNSIKQAVGVSHNYDKSLSVPYPNTGYLTSNRLLPTAVVVATGTATGSQINLQTNVTKDLLPELQDNWIKVKFGVSADNPIVSPSFSIDWDIRLSIGGDELAPMFTLIGKHDGFPACEVYVRDSDGNSGSPSGTKILQFDPIPLGRDPSSLFDLLDDEDVNEQGLIE
jgi:hypothetical protein